MMVEIVPPKVEYKNRRLVNVGLPEGQKRCCTCKEVRNTDNFHKSKHKKDGLQDECIDCQYKRRGLRRGTRGELDPNVIKGFDTAIQKAYAAGFFDGEGTVNFRDNRAPNGKIYKTIHVSIGQTSRPVLEWIQQYYDGYIYEYNKEERKTFWQWSIVGTRASIFLKHIHEFTIVKHLKISEALSAWETRHD